MTVALKSMREDGWMVAVHNDDRFNGVAHPFYHFTHPCGVWAKGKSRTAQAVRR